MDDRTKLPLNLIPKSMMDALGRSLGHGADKYAAHNFRQGSGLAWSLVYAALQRHLVAFWDGENVDKDSGNNHLDNAAAMLSFLIEYQAHPERYKAGDDRYRHGS